MEGYRKLLLRVSDDMKSQESVTYCPQSEYNIFHVLGVAEKRLLCAGFYQIY